MEKIHQNSYAIPQAIEPVKAQCGFLSNSTTPSSPSLLVSMSLPSETINALEELGGALRAIHKRMVTEGYELVDGVIRKIDRPQCI